MSKLQLNTKLIMVQLESRKMKKSDLSRSMGISRQLVDYIFKSKSIHYADKFAAYFNGNAKDYVV